MRPIGPVGGHSLSIPSSLQPSFQGSVTPFPGPLVSALFLAGGAPSTVLRPGSAGRETYVSPRPKRSKAAHVLERFATAA